MSRATGNLSREVRVDADGVVLPGHLVLPDGARALVIFAHGSGSSRHSPRNRYVAEVLNRHGLGTLLLDLLTQSEAERRANVFDIGLLADRLQAATAWAGAELGSAVPGIGYFGASTGAAAALVSAAGSPTGVDAVVCRGGRIDLAEHHLADVAAPVLLIVGGLDHEVLRLNRVAQQKLTGVSELVVVAGATHLFEEPGALPDVALFATEWFTRYLP